MTTQTGEWKHAIEWVNDEYSDSYTVALLSLFWLLGDNQQEELNWHAPFCHVKDEVFVDYDVDHFHDKTWQPPKEGRAMVFDEEGFECRLYFDGKLIASTAMGSRGGWKASAETPDGRVFKADGGGDLWTGWKQIS